MVGRQKKNSSSSWWPIWCSCWENIGHWCGSLKKFITVATAKRTNNDRLHPAATKKKMWRKLLHTLSTFSCWWYQAASHKQWHFV